MVARRRRGARRAAAVPRLRPQRGAGPGVLRHGRALVLVDGFDPRGTLDADRPARRDRRPAWRRRSSPHWPGRSDLARGAGRASRLVLSGASALDPALVTERVPRGDGHHRPAGLRPHRGRAGRSPATLGADRVRRPVRSARAARASSCAWSTTTVERRAEPGDPGEIRVRGRQPLLRLLARRRRRPRRRRLVVDRRRRLPRRRGRPVPGRPGRGAGHRRRVQRLPARGRGRDPPRCRVSRRPP